MQEMNEMARDPTPWVGQGFWYHDEHQKLEFWYRKKNPLLSIYKFTPHHPICSEMIEPHETDETCRTESFNQSASFLSVIKHARKGLRGDKRSKSDFQERSCSGHCQYKMGSCVCYRGNCECRICFHHMNVGERG